MDYTARECDNCGLHGLHVHPANDVKYHMGMREFHFCDQRCKQEWMDDNMHRYAHVAFQLELPIGDVPRCDE